ncbi:unnamed protein product [Polarella glacialis]|uniref:F5/8 type C domain-containing protein n=1 Tax=Polarella glacialis TaxID=89957 RepID=A0A813IJ86_POLGL|nr:unnamed protein product [Polarella glacialis]
MEEKDGQRGSIAVSRQFEVFQRIRYVKLNVYQVLGSNPGGKLGLEDLKVYSVSDNLANRTVAVATATSSWANCASCVSEVDGNFRSHASSFAVDDDFETWWGAQYATSLPGQSYMQIDLGALTQVDIAAIRWKYPAFDVSALCSQTDTGNFDMVGAAFKNTAYLTPIVFFGSYQCKRVRILLGIPAESLGGQGIIGIREVEIYSTSSDVTIGKPIESSDSTNGVLATDDSDVTTWMSASKAVTSLTIDTETNFTAWGARLLSPSTSVIANFEIQVSDDGETFETVYKVEGNQVNDLWIIQRFSGRYVRAVFQQTSASTFYVRTFRVFATANYALNAPSLPEKGWEHSGYQAVDGLDNTYWISEPFATTATLRLVLAEQTFVAGGVKLVWMFPAEDFRVYLSNDTVTWNLLYNVTGNLENITLIGGYWEAKYMDIRMDRASQLNGDGIYALFSWNVYFDPNLAHFKPLEVTATISQSQFRPENAIDGDESTIWMPRQGTTSGKITFDLSENMIISGFDVYWRRPPRAYRMEYEEADTGIWKLVHSWNTTALNVGPQQYWTEGFSARRIMLVVEDVQTSEEGLIVALQDVRLYIPVRGNAIDKNIALKRVVEVSANTIVGNVKEYAVDGNERGTYWHPGWGIRQAWLLLNLDFLPPGQLPPGHDLARIQVMWRWAPDDLLIELAYDNSMIPLGHYTGVTSLVTDIPMMRKALKIKFSVDSSRTDEEIGILQVKVWKRVSAYPPAVVKDPDPWMTHKGYMVDRDLQSYWMGPPLDGGNLVTVTIDLGKIYNATDIQIYFGFRPQVLFLYTSTDGVVYNQSLMTSGKTLGLLTLKEQGLAFVLRYVRLKIMRGYIDPDGGQWGSTIRDFAVVQFSNLARGKLAYADNIWSYPPEWTVDSELGLASGDPDQPVAGMEWMFGYVAQKTQVHYADTNANDTNWRKATEVALNQLQHVVVPTTVHFKARYIRLSLTEPVSKDIWDPDDYGNIETWSSLFSILDFKVYEHTGGGGVMGFQSLDGMQYTTITYGLRQPEEWIISSERDILTKDVVRPSYVTDVGRLVQVVLTTRKVAQDKTTRTFEVAIYKNGMPYGDPYIRTVPLDRMHGPHSTRIVMGVRSSAHEPEVGAA